MDLWFTERQNDSVALSLRITRTVHREQTAYQDLAVLESPHVGRVLALDGCVMTTDMDEFVYHEMIAHVPLCTHPDPRTVLVVGGGDGGTVREVLKHPSVQSVTLAEIDEGVVEASRRFLPRLSVALDDPRCRVQIGDGAEHVKAHPRAYDVVICDSTDPVGPGTVLFSPEFYASVFDALSEDGVFCAQTESPFFRPDLIARVLGSLRASFPIVRLYLATVPTYPGALWSFALASKGRDPLADARTVPLDTRYYTPEIHRAAFVLPRFVLDMVEAHDRDEARDGAKPEAR